MKKHIILLGTLLNSGIAFSQVGINTQAPNSTMDVSAKRDAGGNITDNSQLIGLQAPRLTRLELTNSTATYGANQKGALIYITDVSGGNTLGQRVNVTAAGYYHFDGAVWVKTGSGAAIEPWNVQATSNSAQNNTDNIYQQGKVGVGFTSSDAISGRQFEVKGDMKAAYLHSTTGKYYGLDTGMNAAGTKVAALYTSDTADPTAATDFTGLTVFPGDATVQYNSSSQQSSFGVNAGKSEMHVNDITNKVENRIVAGTDGNTAQNNIVLLSQKTDATGNYSKATVDKTTGINFNYGTSSGSTGSYTFPKTNGTANQVLTTDGASPNATLSWKSVTPIAVVGGDGADAIATSAPIQARGSGAPVIPQATTTVLANGTFVLATKSLVTFSYTVSVHNVLKYGGSTIGTDNIADGYAKKIGAFLNVDGTGGTSFSTTINTGFPITNDGNQGVNGYYYLTISRTIVLNAGNYKYDLNGSLYSADKVDGIKATFGGSSTDQLDIIAVPFP